MIISITYVRNTLDSSTEPSMTDKEGVLILMDRLGTKYLEN